MRWDALSRVGLGAARHRLTGARAPLMAFVSVTNRCDASCNYCHIPYDPAPEPTTLQLVQTIDALADAGCQAITLTGGEPLTREDVPQLVAHCRSRRLWIRLETTGYRYPQLAKQLALDQVVLPLDGDRRAHDITREPGSYEQVLLALETARALEVPLLTRTVLTRHAVDKLDHVLGLAEEHGHLATFQLLAPGRPKLAPDDAQLRRALRFLLEARRHDRPVAMTEKTLRSMLQWPCYDTLIAPHPVDDQHCSAGETHCYVDTAGGVHSCAPQACDAALSHRDVGFDAAFDAIDRGACQACVAGDLTELNQLMNLNLPTVLGVIQTKRLRG